MFGLRLLEKYPLMRAGNAAGDTSGGTSSQPDSTTAPDANKCKGTPACGTNQACIGEGTASGTGATQVNANHIIQYPRQPKMDDGKWIAVASLLGALLSKFADNGTISKAKDAESAWKRINEQLADKGNEMWNNMPDAESKANGADNDLQNQYGWNIAQRDAELARAEKLDDCNDSLHEKTCAFANCGYVPDYDGIKARIMSDVAGQTAKARRQMMRGLNRYSARLCCSVETALATTALSTTVSALYKAREDERARAWQINEGLLFKTTEMMEQHRNARFGLANTLDAKGISLQQARYTAHNANYFQLAQLGADFLTSAGKNYAWLAESYRKTADKMTSSLASLGALIAVVLDIFLDKKSNENPC